VVVAAVAIRLNLRVLEVVDARVSSMKYQPETVGSLEIVMLLSMTLSRSFATYVIS
jgi:hypothetical protein